MAEKQKKMYVDNNLFYECIVKYKNAIQLAKEENKQKPRIPEFAGLCIKQIAENMSTMKNNRGSPAFQGYSFVDEMISDALENSFKYFDNFDPEKSKNPFAYFTRIIYYAFLRRIAQEKKQLYFKYKTALNYGIFNAVSSPDSESESSSFEMFDNLIDYVEQYETKQREKKKKAKESKIVEIITTYKPPSGNTHHRALVYDILLPNTYVVSVSTGEANSFCLAHNIKWSTLIKTKKTKGYSIVTSKPFEEFIGEMIE